MFIKGGNEFADQQMAFLSDYLELIDSKLSSIQLCIKKSLDPESDGLLDKGEYFIGVGFVVIQQYLVDTLTFINKNKFDAYSLGPIHPSGETYVNLINSAANWWKHEAEWIGNNWEVPKNGQATYKRVKSIVDAKGYELSQVLHSICALDELSFKPLIPILIQWREDIDRA